MRFQAKEIEFFERQVKFRLPFRFGAVTLTEAPQVFARARIRLENGKEASGGAAEVLVPKWFDKDPQITNEQNIEQLRSSLAIARDGYLAGANNTGFGHFVEIYGPQIALCAAQGLNSLIACFGPALIDRALLDALCRALNVSFYEAIRKNLPGISAPGWQQDLMAFDIEGYLATLTPHTTIAARHTVGLLDPVSAPDNKKRGDGLPSTLEGVIERYGHRYFKVKVGGDLVSDLERLAAIARVLDRLPQYHVTLDGNEQYADMSGIGELYEAMRLEPRLKRFVSRILFIEQPIQRGRALSGDISKLAEHVPVIIDESDDSLEAFPRARRLGYTGVSSKTCKGLYKSILNSARCRLWNMEEGANRYFMSGEDLTIQPGLALQQDLALVALLGIAHVERNGHHYVNGMAGIPDPEQNRFLAAHGDLYERSHGAVRPRIVDGELSIGSLNCEGYASGAMPDWDAMEKTT